MYNYIIGKVVDTGINRVVIENNGIGYEIGVSGNTLQDAGAIGQTMKVYTFLYVREDAFALYGFSRLEEKSLFLHLIEISGIGPKMAMQILDGYDLQTLTVAIASGDSKTLCKIKGLGKKTAEMILLNLRDKVAEEMTDITTNFNISMDDDVKGAIFALVSLGISNTEAVKAVQEAVKSVSGVENIIAFALRQMT